MHPTCSLWLFFLLCCTSTFNTLTLKLNRRWYVIGGGAMLAEAWIDRRNTLNGVYSSPPPAPNSPREVLKWLVLFVNSTAQTWVRHWDLVSSRDVTTASRSIDLYEPVTMFGHLYCWTNCRKVRREGGGLLQIEHKNQKYNKKGWISSWIVPHESLEKQVSVVCSLLAPKVCI